MNPQAPLDINVVYDASKRRVPRGPAGQTYRAVRGQSFLVLGVLNLAVAWATYYGIWWRVDPFLYVRFMVKGYVPGLDLNQAASIFGGQVPGTEEAPRPQPEPTSSAVPKYTGQSANIIIAVTAYSWLTLAMIASCAVALASGAALGRACDARWRRAGLFGALGLLVVLVLVGYGVWAKFGMQYRPNHLRTGMGGLVLLAALLGVAVGRGVRGWTVTASVLIILSATGSAVGLYYATQCGLISSAELPFGVFYFAALVFMLHSAWGWVLLAISPRLAR